MTSAPATTVPDALSAPLPDGRGELSAGLRAALLAPPGAPVPDPAAAAGADPLGDDLQLSLYLAYELHYRGFTGVDPAWEWDPGLLRLRAALERRFLDALREGTAGHPDLDAVLEGILVEPVSGTGVSYHLSDEGTLEQMREYAAHRSLYHLKEADPHVWVIPRLRGRAKAAFVAVEYDEFGGGRAERVHAELFAALMRDLRLDDSYGRYADAASAEMLCTVNLMSLFGLHRALRGALVGHFAAVETTSSPGSRRLARAMRRLEAGPAAEHFYAEHITADAVHEQVVRREVIGGLLDDEPSLARDMAFGVAATGWVEDRFGVQLMSAWQAGRSSLRVPLDRAPAGG
ncbi:iron-containing redox enzyme family protein [Streptomyces genisteinicus]|uniref:Iron-containing redox enzyme family protein n=1 Tax=Streptomyces genisteinicus TaxID=2768068 RepID=A0A7H0HMN6_9ACTN|nr:iron-containing redox enzyme family protein [Streptomyces genisteinicus]QNP61802.1 iron-containing redox enzyme family protein [Streptomyces genisteinicus]